MKHLLHLFIPLLLFVQPATAQNALTYNAALPSYIDAGNSMNTQFTGTNTITLEAWCFQTANVFLPTIVGNYLSGMQFLLRVDGNKAAFWVDNGTGFKNALGASTIPLNTWVHIAGVWDGSAMKVYVNGVLDATLAAVAGAFPASTNPVRIGANQLGEAWTGKLDAVRIWKTARTVAQINAGMSSCLSGSETGLLALYNFEEGTGTTVADLTGHGYTGNFVSTPLWTAGHSCSVVLPITFESVTAAKNNNGIAVSWKVAAESNIVRYETERSADGRNFSTAGSTPANGSSTYSWLDAAPLQGVSFYRVKSIGLMGEVKYTGIVKVTATDEHAAITVWPNPVTGNTMHIQFTRQPKGNYDIQLADAAGLKIFTTTVQHTGGNSAQTITLPASVYAGIYQLLVIAADKTTVTQKVFISNN